MSTLNDLIAERNGLLDEKAALLELLGRALHYIETPGDFSDQERVDLETDMAAHMPSDEEDKS